MRGKKLEVVGEVYGRLTITGEADPHISRSRRKQRKVSYVCSCGVEGEALLGNILRGNTTSCGCLLKEGNATKHGKYGTRLYKVYYNMRNRCSTPKGQSYVNYGGRGIKVCEEWNKSIEEFYKWALENGYEEGLSIERVDVNKGYNPDNCTWITRAEQGLNKRMLKNNTSGITGVNYRAGQGIWIASWEVGGKTGSKSFSVKKYGDTEAKQMAIDKRKEMEKVLGITNNDPKTTDKQEEE